MSASSEWTEDGKVDAHKVGVDCQKGKEMDFSKVVVQNKERRVRVVCFVVVSLAQAVLWLGITLLYGGIFNFSVLLVLRGFLLLLFLGQLQTLIAQPHQCHLPAQASSTSVRTHRNTVAQTLEQAP